MASKALAAMKEKVRTLTRRTVERSVEQVCDGLRVYVLRWRQLSPGRHSGGIRRPGRMDSTPTPSDSPQARATRHHHISRTPRSGTIRMRRRKGGIQRPPLVKKLGTAHQRGVSEQLRGPTGSARLAAYPQLFEPPGADPHAGRRGRVCGEHRGTDVDVMQAVRKSPPRPMSFHRRKFLPSLR